MKQKLKKLKLLFALTLAGILLYGCQVEEEEIVENLKEQKGIIMHKKFEDLIQETQFKTAFDKMNQPKKGSSHKSGTTSKTVMENRYNFKIVDYPASVVVTNDLTSYTFLITRDSILNNTFENLVVNVKENQAPKAYLYKYKLNTNINILQHNLANLSGTKEIKEIIYDVSQAQSFGDGSGTNCVITSTWVCGGPGNHDGPAGGACGGGASYTISCSETSGGGGGNNNTGYSGGIGGGSTTSPNNPIGGGGNNGPTIVTAPVKPPPPMLKRENCDVKKKLENDAIFKNKLSGMLSYARTASFESFNVLYNATSATPTYNFKYDLQNGTVAAPNVAYAADTNMLGVIHTHYGSLFSIFSGQDLYDLYIKLKTYPQITDNIFLGLVTSKDTAYLLQIEDRDAFIAFGDANMPTEDELKDFMEEKMAKKYGMYMNGNSATNELGFYKMMSDLNMGVNLSSASIPSTSPPTLPSASMFDTWTTKSFDKKTRQMITLNCL